MPGSELLSLHSFAHTLTLDSWVGYGPAQEGFVMAKRRAMLLLTYNLGDHVDHQEYEQWLREVDNPFFNKVPGVKRYANWKVLGEKLGTVAFTHYDLLELDDLDAWERGLRESKATEICPGWTKRWSAHGTDEQYTGLNF